MDASDISEGFSEWEQVSDPYDHQPSSSPPNPENHEYKLVLKENYYSDESSIFPPTDHEGLPLLPTDYKSSGEDAASVTSSSAAVSETGRLTRDPINPNSKLSVIIRDIRIRISTIKKMIWTLFPTNFRCQNSSMRRSCIVIPGGVLAIALLACLKFLQWKNRLMLMIREKDQRISQLLSQIAHMNEMLSAPRKVPILRIH